MSLSLGVGSTASFCSFFVFDSFLVGFSVDFFSVVFFATFAFGSALPCSLLYFSIATSYPAFSLLAASANSDLSLSFIAFHFSDAVFASSAGFFVPSFFVNASRFLFRKRKKAL